AQKRGVQFLYETNVGAGLPIISTLNDLIISGDQITRIEGVLSGSLSFIFNSFREVTSFSSIVQEARKRGYTEPYPRVDLSGLDVRRKLIILARESGYPIEAKEVVIENILPTACQEAETVDAFFTALAAADDYFEAIRKEAATEGKALRMIAKLDNGQ